MKICYSKRINVVQLRRRAPVEVEVEVEVEVDNNVTQVGEKNGVESKRMAR